MKLVYVSHPFSGGEPWKNRADAREVCGQLKNDHPDWCIFNPLDAFQWLDFIKISYEKTMEMCLEVLDRCDAIYLCQGWEESKGCRKERRAAQSQGLEIIYED